LVHQKNTQLSADVVLLTKFSLKKKSSQEGKGKGRKENILEWGKGGKKTTI